MSVEIQYCMKDNSDDESHIQSCTKEGCDGVLYYSEVDESYIDRQMDTFYAFAECTECDEYSSRDNTAPRYLTWRVVVRV